MLRKVSVRTTEYALPQGRKSIAEEEDVQVRTQFWESKNFPTFFVPFLQDDFIFLYCR